MLRRLARVCDVLGGEEPRMTVVVQRAEVASENPDEFARGIRDLYRQSIKDWPSA